MLKTKSGFTIVELLIVIVVIAILAAISVVAYNGIQSRANDSRIKTAADQVEKAMRLYLADNSTFPTGLGWYSSAPAPGTCPGSSGGWAARTAYGHDCTLEFLLASNNLLPTGYMTSLPRNKFLNATSGNTVLMFYRCTNVSATHFVLFWYLESPTSSEVSNFDTIASQCNLANLKTLYGMQAAKLLDLR